MSITTAVRVIVRLSLAWDAAVTMVGSLRRVCSEVFCRCPYARVPLPNMSAMATCPIRMTGPAPAGFGPACLPVGVRLVRRVWALACLAGWLGAAALYGAPGLSSPAAVAEPLAAKGDNRVGAIANSLRSCATVGAHYAALCNLRRALAALPAEEQSRVAGNEALGLKWLQATADLDRIVGLLAELRRPQSAEEEKALLEHCRELQRLYEPGRGGLDLFMADVLAGKCRTLKRPDVVFPTGHVAIFMDIRGFLAAWAPPADVRQQLPVAAQQAEALGQQLGDFAAGKTTLWQFYDHLAPALAADQARDVERNLEVIAVRLAEKASGLLAAILAELRRLQEADPMLAKLSKLDPVPLGLRQADACRTVFEALQVVVKEKAGAVARDHQTDIPNRQPRLARIRALVAELADAKKGFLTPAAQAELLAALDDESLTMVLEVPVFDRADWRLQVDDVDVEAGKPRVLRSAVDGRQIPVVWTRQGGSAYTYALQPPLVFAGGTGVALQAPIRPANVALAWEWAADARPSLRERGLRPTVSVLQGKEWLAVEQATVEASLVYKFQAALPGYCTRSWEKRVDLPDPTGASRVFIVSVPDLQPGKRRLAFPWQAGGDSPVVVWFRKHGAAGAWTNAAGVEADPGVAYDFRVSFDHGRTYCAKRNVTVPSDEQGDGPFAVPFPELAELRKIQWQWDEGVPQEYREYRNEAGTAADVEVTVSVNRQEAAYLDCQLEVSRNARTVCQRARIGGQVYVTEIFPPELAREDMAALDQKAIFRYLDQLYVPTNVAQVLDARKEPDFAKDVTLPTLMFPWGVRDTAAASVPEVMWYEAWQRAARRLKEGGRQHPGAVEERSQVYRQLVAALRSALAFPGEMSSGQRERLHFAVYVLEWKHGKAQPRADENPGAGALWERWRVFYEMRKHGRDLKTWQAYLENLRRSPDWNFLFGDNEKRLLEYAGKPQNK